MTRLVVAYDAERLGACYPASVRLVALHERLGIPATWFIVGELLEREPEWKRLLRPGIDDGLFEVASHGWSHALIRTAPNGDPAVSDEQRWLELAQGKLAVEDAFGRACLGYRPANGWPGGLASTPEDIRRDYREAGYRYVSSALWGQGFTEAVQWEPVPIRREGVLEMPAAGPHDTTLIPYGQEPSEVALGVYSDRLQRIIDREWLPYVSFIWHPFRWVELDPDLRALRQIVEMARLFFGGCSTFAAEYARVAQREEVAA